MTTTSLPAPATDDIDRTLRALLARIAPDADVNHLDGGADIRATLDIDSFDFLQFVVAIKDALGVEIPEASYRDIRTLDGCRKYVAERRRS